MKAIVYHQYGSADVLRREEVAKPVPKDNEVLIQVRAATINPLDWRLMHGNPRLLVEIARLMKQGVGHPGVDVAGHIEAVGKSAKDFRVGDDVFGSCRGALTEYVCTPESNIARKPDEITFEQAASLNLAGLTALQGLRDKAKLREGQRVLINGAAGGVGTFAVQIAKIIGAKTTGVCSTRNVEFVQSLGADHAIDYTKEDFTELATLYDVVFECIGNKRLSAVRRVLKPGGRCILVGARHDLSLLDVFSVPLKVISASLFSSRKVKMFLAKPNRADLTTLGEWAVAGRLTPVIDRCYGLSDSAEAMRYLEGGHARGKVIITVNNERRTLNEVAESD